MTKPDGQTKQLVVKTNLAHLLTDGRFAAKPTKESQTQWQNNGDEMNPPTLHGFRTSLLNRVRVADREIVRSKKRKNFRAELLKLNALQAIQFLDDYIERASDDQLS